MKILAPDWYAEAIGPPCESIEARLRSRLPGWLGALAGRVGALRGALLFVVAGDADRVALVKKAPGTLAFLALEAWLRRGPRRVVLLAFLPRELPRAGWRRLAYRAFFAVVERPAVRRGMLAGHVLTDWERREYAGLYRIDPERLHHVPWAFCRWGVEPPPFDAEQGGVLSSGRASCDWETLFAAAEGAAWPLTVICGHDDLPRIKRLNRTGRATVLCEAPHEVHDRALREAALYAICLAEDGPSAGHVRMMSAVEAGTPVVATRVRGLDGYVEEGRNAVTVPPSDPAALRRAIDGLLADPGARRRLRETALERAASWTYRDYFGAIGALLVDASE